jgi:outer membrane protein insertion porin family
MFDYTRYIQLTGNRKQAQNNFGTSKTKRNLVLVTRAHFGYIGKYNSNFDIGPFERYSMGGSGITGFSFLLGTDVIGLRGYNDNSIPAPGVHGVAYDKFVLEMRYPIVTQGIATIFVLGFLEGGNNWVDHSQINVFDMYRSYGVGARIFMPAFGMIGIDWGKGLDVIPGCAGCNRGQIHFTIGQQIR